MTEQLTADVVIVGAGASGAMAGWRLASLGVDVLMLEAGPAVVRSRAVQTFRQSLDKGPNSPYPPAPYAPHPMGTNDYYVQDGPDLFGGLYLRVVGGTTWHWTGFAERLRPTDFRQHSTYGVGVDWPVDYADLEDWYEEAEREWGVAGYEEATAGAPRRGPFPMDGIPPTWLDKQVEQAANRLGWHLEPFAHARNSRVYDGRPSCCGNNSCVPICPVAAKYDASVHVGKARQAGARLETGCVVHRVTVGPDGQVSGLHFRRPDGSQGVATARTYVLACHAIETPKLLLMSRDAATPDGVANSSGAVGRYLTSQVNINSWGLTAEPVYPYRGPQQTSGILEFRDGPFRAEHAGVGTSLMNSSWHPGTGPLDLADQLIGQGYRGHRLQEELVRQISRRLRLNSSAEILPDADNRVTPDADAVDSSGLPRPRIQFRFGDYALAGLRLAVDRHLQILAELGATDVATDAPEGSSAIMAGTARMGADPRSSVVDAELRSHDHPNLTIMGLAVHPTSPVNAPTLTTAALALRAAHRIADDLHRL